MCLTVTELRVMVCTPRSQIWLPILKKLMKNRQNNSKKQEKKICSMGKKGKEISDPLYPKASSESINEIKVGIEAREMHI